MISRKTLRNFWEAHPDGEQPLKAWHSEAEKATWTKPADIKARYRSASFVGSDPVVFDIGGNKYRLVVAVRYDAGLVLVRFIATHEDYDDIEVATI